MNSIDGVQAPTRTRYFFSQLSLHYVCSTLKKSLFLLTVLSNVAISGCKRGF